MKVSIWDEKRLAGNGVVASSASARLGRPAAPGEPHVRPARREAHLALVGKGITFDSGGLSLKPGSSMQTMKLDMAGAAAVVAATVAIAELGLPIKVSAYACLAENMPSGGPPVRATS